mmetsp:Transcript_5675/g.7094  ORF Transcript_5675/g.7094 Transcript_5675/m.7094 type:complete len:613 (-) Transcript_5675:419-2257(-)
MFCCRNPKVVDETATGPTPQAKSTSVAEEDSAVEEECFEKFDQKEQQIIRTRSRSRFVLDSYEKKCRIGNPNIGSFCVKFIPRDVFLQLGAITQYEECVKDHIRIVDLNDGSVILFVSHRWQDASRNLPDQDEIQFGIVKEFLMTEEGQKVTHIWVDFSCITQNRTTAFGFRNFSIQLDNIQTAIMLADYVLVVPRVETESGHFTDLSEINDRGWCLFEVVAAMYCACKIYVSFVADGKSAPQFFNIEGELEGPLSVEALQESIGVKDHSHEKSRSYRGAVHEAIEKFGLPKNNVAASNWDNAKDPWEVVHQIRTVVESSFVETYFNGETAVTEETGQRRMVSLTVNTLGVDGLGRETYSHGREISALLPNFTVDSDREVVTNLMLNVAGFVHTAYDDIREMSQEEISSMCEDLDTENNHLLQRFKWIFPVDLDNLLENLPATPNLNLEISWNPLGMNGSSALLKHQPKLTFTDLNLFACSIGDAGLRTICKILTRDDCQLKTLWVECNGISDIECLANALKENKTLDNLRLNGNRITEVKSLADALKTNNVVTGINLYKNHIEDVFDLADALKTNKAVEHLDLCGNPKISWEGKAAIKAAWGIRTNGRLDL